ncbi:DUF2075 domain-containing protein [Kitasatospora sp. NPDC002227]|uniref:DUF2075 domain-containing protein n=1 Tax=Kitasatospora sp. NPDC002227 TaxID=3154773 RepID=UPI003322DDA3
MFYRGPASVLAVRALSGDLVSAVEQQALQVGGRLPSPGDLQVWERGLPAVLGVLLEAGLDEVEVLVGYTLPFTSKSADLVLAGIHPVTGAPSYVLVEVKLWSRAEPEHEHPSLYRVAGLAHPVLNPIEQVSGYCEYLISYNETLTGHPERVSGVAFLPSATDLMVQDVHNADTGVQVALFTGDHRAEFIGFLQSRVAPRGGAESADRLLSAKVGPVPQVMSAAAAEVREHEQFVLLDEQKVAFELVLDAVRRAGRSDRKEGVLVTGGPGTGKTVIGLSLLGELYRGGYAVMHATGSHAFTHTLRKVAGARKREVRDLFKYFNSFLTAEHESLDVLICDEAHRIRATSANRYTSQAQRTGRSQVQELIDAARVPVFLLDEDQVVRPGEIGTAAGIRKAAQEMGVSLREVELDKHFRAGGSDAYLQWVVRLLGLAPGDPLEWTSDGRMTLTVADSPQELEDFLAARLAEGYSARITAGYCWNWTKKTSSADPLPLDVQIGDWARPWNVFGDRAVGGAPPAALWATDPAGFGQVGVVYTAQGFEYDWCGVIIGPDLVWRSDRWVCDRTESKDPALSKSVSDADVDRFVRNTYKVLLTRGMVGTVIYSTDAETRAKLHELVSPGSGPH